MTDPITTAQARGIADKLQEEGYWESYSYLRARSQQALRSLADQLDAANAELARVTKEHAAAHKARARALSDIREAACMVGMSPLDCVKLLKADRDATREQLDAANADGKESAVLIAKLTDLLTDTAKALKGEPGPLMSHDWSDLANVAAKLKTERDAANAEISGLRALVGTIRDLMGCRVRNVSDIDVESHSKEIMARFYAVESERDAANEELAALREQVRQGTWIPCSERLPDFDRPVLAAFPRQAYPQILLRALGGPSQPYLWVKVHYDTVINASPSHWMPLPPAPDQRPSAAPTCWADL